MPPVHSLSCDREPPPHVALQSVKGPQAVHEAHGSVLHAYCNVADPKQPLWPTFPSTHSLVIRLVPPPQLLLQSDQVVQFVQRGHGSS